jgi:cyclopropane-fatty-acyl-phospholipid synthase
MRRYMWPNSCLPSATALITAVHRSSSGRFTLERVENHAAHYSRTLREWGRRLEARLTPATLGLDVVISEPTDQLPSKIAHVDALFTAGKGVKPAASLGPTTTQLEETLLRHLPLHKSVAAALDYQAIKRKWQYLFAYAAAGFTKGYITCKSSCGFVCISFINTLFYRPYVNLRPWIGCPRPIGVQ